MIWTYVERLGWLAGIASVLVAVWFARRTRWWIKGLSVLVTVALMGAILFLGPKYFDGTPPPKACELAGPTSWPQPTHVLPSPGTSVQKDQKGQLVVSKGQNNEVVRAQDGGWVPLGRSTVGTPVAIANAYGTMVGFAIGMDGILWANPHISSTCDVSNAWQNLGSKNFEGTPAVTQELDGRLAVVARSNDETLWESHQTQQAGSTWSPWQKLPLHADSDPVIYRDAVGTLRLFVLAKDKQLWSMSFADDWKSEPRSIGGNLAEPPAVVMDGQGCLQVFSTTGNGSLWQKGETGRASDQWTRWYPLKAPTPVKGRPIAVQDAHGSAVVFVVNSEGSVWHTWLDHANPGDMWNHWTNIQGNIDQLVGVTRRADDLLGVYGIGKSGEMKETHQTLSGPDIIWPFWSLLGGVFTHS